MQDRRSCARPGLAGRRSSTASTSPGVVPWSTPASWHARASASTPSTAARSTRVRATVVTGMPRTVVASRGSMRRLRQVMRPSMRRSPRAITSGGGAGPRSRPCRCAAARPRSSAPVATRLHRRGVSRLPARRAVTDPVDAAVLDEQRARADPPLDLGAPRFPPPGGGAASHDAVPLAANRARISSTVLPWDRIATHRQDDRRIRPRRRVPCTALAPWRSGYAAACKAVYTGSIPVGAFDDRRSRTSEATTPAPRIAAIPGRLYSGPILPTNSAATSFAPMNTSSAASAVLR